MKISLNPVKASTLNNIVKIMATHYVSTNNISKLKKRIIFTIILVLIACLMGYALYASVIFFVKKPYEIEQNQVIVNLSYGYDIYPKISSLYESDKTPLPMGRKNYFVNLTKKIDFKVIAEINTKFQEQENNNLYNMDINILLRAPDQWEKKLVFKPEIISSSEMNKTILSSYFTLPFNEANTLADSIIKEIEIAPSGGYGIVVQNVLSGFKNNENDTVPDNYVNEFTFTVKQPGIIEPQEELVKNLVITLNEIRKANYANLWGATLDIPNGRIISIGIFLILIVIFILCYYLLFKKTFLQTSRSGMLYDSIIKKYANRIVQVNTPGDLPEDIIRVETNDFKELLKLSNERERPILHFYVAKENKNSNVFFILDEKVYFFYRLLMES